MLIAGKAIGTSKGARRWGKGPEVQLLPFILLLRANLRRVVICCAVFISQCLGVSWRTLVNIKP